MYKLHTVDIYLWTAEDGSLFLDSLRRVLAEGQIRVVDAPPTEHRDSMSPVVQQLERVAISTPSVTGQRDSIGTTNTAQSQPARATPVSPPTSVSSDATPQYAPIAAYNPAAPSAPEPIAHREKTPPPPDAASGTGLKAASQHETGAPQFAGPPQQAYGQQPYFAGPPGQPQPGIQRATTTAAYTTTPPQAQQAAYAPTFAAPPTQAQDPNAQFMPQQAPLQRQATMPASFGPFAPSTISSTVSGQTPSPTPSGAPPAYQAQAAPTFPPQPSPGFAPQQQDPNAQFMPQQPQQGSYAYGNHATSNISHSIHNQLYYPEEGAHGHGHGHGAPQAGPGQAGAVGKLEQKASKYEKKLNKFFKRLDSGF